MKRKVLFGLWPVIILFMLCGGVARAQGGDAPKVEVGAQYSSLSINAPGRFSPGTDNAPGVGARVTFNVTDYFAVEAEGNIYPSTVSRTFASGGDMQQLQAGVKVGKRMPRWGVFAKARPGFVSFAETLRPVVVDLPLGILSFERERKTHFSMDLGGVLEFYPSRRLVVRFDAGDTIIRYGEHDVLAPFLVPPGTFPIVREPSEIKHNFQFTAGVGVRFGGGAEIEPPTEPGRDGVRRFEAGVQFSSLLFNVPAQGFPVFGPFDSETEPEVGVGGRFGFNLNDHVALEAEGNFYTRESFPSVTTGGFPLQFQAGVKAGKRWERWGLFGKARPGLISFSRVSHLTGTQTITFNDDVITFGIFDDRRKNYFSMDLGAVVEFYHSRRFFTRFDAGDTIIRYDERTAQTFFGNQAIFFNLPAETKHNFQFTAGLGFRF